jgi:uncharacterized protein
MTFNFLREKVLERLTNDLDPRYTFHNAKHTDHVLRKAIYIAKKENVFGKDLLLVKLAALYHDTGFLVSRHDHEMHSCRIARDEICLIPGLTKEDIDTVCDIILATRIPQKPNTLLEKIMADADLEHLSSRFFDEFSKQLYAEMKALNPDLDPEKWRLEEIRFLENHRYHTEYFRRVREPVKRRLIEKIKLKTS